MFKKKVYGSYQVPSCYFCGAQATSKNKQHLPVCRKCVNKEPIKDARCPSCNAELEIKQGKFGTFFLCNMGCGPISLSKYLRFNKERGAPGKYKTQKNDKN
jgi:hypothetical protein